MDSLHEEIQKLLDTAEANRRQFLKVETVTCNIAVDRGRLELSLGNSEEAQKEYHVATRGVEAIEHFLSEAREDLPEIQSRLARLKVSVEALRQEIESFPR